MPELGLSWVNIGGGIRGAGPVQSLALEAAEPPRLYVGTAYGGVFVGQLGP